MKPLDSLLVRLLLADRGHYENLRRLARAEGRSVRELVAGLAGEGLAHRQSNERLRRDWLALTPRQREVALLACQGLTSSQIAARLYLSEGTVKTHFGHALHKLGAGSKKELRERMYAAGLLEGPVETPGC